MTRLPNLHDATLKNVNLDWATAIVQLTFKMSVTSSDTLTIEAESITNLECPRLLPWGSSNSVNLAKLESVEGGQILTIEMQSGDVLEVHGRVISIKRTS